METCTFYESLLVQNICLMQVCRGRLALAWSCCHRRKKSFLLPSHGQRFHALERGNACKSFGGSGEQSMVDLQTRVMKVCVTDCPYPVRSTDPATSSPEALTRALTEAKARTLALACHLVNQPPREKTAG